MLSIKNISKTFSPGTVNEKTALRNLSLEMARGDFVTIIGSNGAGKSTLFNAIAGAFYVDEGRILLDGEDITFQREHLRSRNIGHLFQDPLLGTAPHMSVEENMALVHMQVSGKRSPFARVSGKERKLFREQLALLGMGLEERMHHPVGLLSGGQRQALTLLMATMVAPKLLLLDEHTAALDPAAAQKVLQLTKDIVAARNITCLMITHNMHQALDIGSRTLMMDGGRIILDIAGRERENMTVETLLEKFRRQAGEALCSDRILLSEQAG